MSWNVNRLFFHVVHLGGFSGLEKSCHFYFLISDAWEKSCIFVSHRAELLGR